MSKKSEAKMLTTKEVAERVGAAEISVRIWAAKGRFVGARKEDSPRGDYWLIPESALIGFEMSRPGPKPNKKGKTK